MAELLYSHIELAEPLLPGYYNIKPEKFPNYDFNYSIIVGEDGRAIYRMTPRTLNPNIGWLEQNQNREVRTARGGRTTRLPEDTMIAAIGYPSPDADAYLIYTLIFHKESLPK